MAPFFLTIIFSLFVPALLNKDGIEKSQFRNCPPFYCGNLGEIKFPFTNSTRPEYCGPFVIDDCNKVHPNIQLEKGGRWYELENISQANTLLINDKVFQKQLSSNSCESFNSFSLPSFPYLSLQIISNLTLLKCNPTAHAPSRLKYIKCNDLNIYYGTPNRSLPSIPLDGCSILQLPVNLSKSNSDIFGLLTARFYLEVHDRSECYKCFLKHGNCLLNKTGNFQCFDPHEDSNNVTDPTKGDSALQDDKSDRSLKLSLGLSFGLGGLAAMMIISSSVIIICWRYKESNTLRDRISITTTPDPSEPDLDGAIVCYGVPVFSYVELEEATQNFSTEKELGNGGYGTVYHGKLQDGREVAIKRLQEHNYKRVKQFFNEIKVLTGLKHKNLVSLYGCASSSSHKLLLVYECIPNGTVADHLHGDRAKFGRLTWPIRIRIASETACAIAYLHASDIIHRDVKTSNILLDKDFHVKVADFGLSKLFPGNVSHVSTVPQGTPGYVDPEYYHFYQLTEKSDVYSFGVVLIELLSSKPAVDMTRERHEINLANLAISKILKGAFDELIDHNLGYKSNEEVKRMTILVAELAFLCLQQDQEMRPSMIEVFEQLKKIEAQALQNLEDEHHFVEVSKSLENTHTTQAVPLLKNSTPPHNQNL
ncbi:hypothetical protein Tsubulata_041404 [Turnera subulata]|uniref:Protein kinase domain-containing protein n=1 Tax=Turnera subulata TaxID=218843 RepID=A0A9Q0J0D6_9ROSI|nr:hypothetical protein Tsubulata_041404 [Turnera subulata]